MGIMNMEVTLGIAFIAGFLSFVSPCVLPLVPAYIGYMSGRMTHSLAIQTVGVKREQATSLVARANMLLHGLAFVAGFTLIFVTIGLMTTAFVSVLGNTATVLRLVIERVGGMLIIIFGLQFMGVLPWILKKLKEKSQYLTVVFTLTFGLLATGLIAWATIELLIILPLVATLWLFLFLGNAFTTPQTFWLNIIERLEYGLFSDTRQDMSEQQNSGLWGSFMMGIVFSAGWTPCIGPIYGTILTLAANTGDVGAATPMLIAYSLGLGIPFILAATLIGQTQYLLRRIQRHLHKIEIISGTLLVIIGVAVASGQLSNLSRSLGTEFVDTSLRVEECGMGFVQGELQFSHVGSCFNGTLFIVNPDRTKFLDPFTAPTALEFVYHAEESQVVSIGFTKYPEGFAPEIAVIDPEGYDYLVSNTLTQPNDDDYAFALTNVLLEKAGYYIIRVNNTSGDFRLRVFTEDIPVTTVPATESTGLVDEVVTEANVALTDQENGLIAPDFTVQTLADETFQLSQLRGSVVILNFWGTWCAPCEREMPALQALYEQYKEQGVIILGIAVNDTTEAVNTFRQEHNITFELALDDNNALTEQFAITGQPSTVVIGKDGRILERYFSLVAQSDLSASIERGLAQ
jgi:cytochrome c-type biogenesis protein